MSEPQFSDTRPPPYMHYPETDVFRRLTWSEAGEARSVVARGPHGTSAAVLDAILMTEYEKRRET